MTVRPCAFCGTLKPIELMAKDNKTLECVSCYTGKKKTNRKDKKQ